MCKIMIPRFPPTKLCTPANVFSHSVFKVINLIGSHLLSVCRDTWWTFDQISTCIEMAICFFFSWIVVSRFIYPFIYKMLLKICVYVVLCCCCVVCKSFLFALLVDSTCTELVNMNYLKETVLAFIWGGGRWERFPEGI